MGLKDLLDILGPEWHTFIKVVLGGFLWHLITKCFKTGIKDIVRLELAKFDGLREELAKNTEGLARIIGEFESQAKRVNAIEVSLMLMASDKKKINGAAIRGH
jgi:hypothetical protein